MKTAGIFLAVVCVVGAAAALWASCENKKQPEPFPDNDDRLTPEQNQLAEVWTKVFQIKNRNTGLINQIANQSTLLSYGFDGGFSEGFF